MRVAVDVSANPQIRPKRRDAGSDCPSKAMNSDIAAIGHPTRSDTLCPVRALPRGRALRALSVQHHSASNSYAFGKRNALNRNR